MMNTTEISYNPKVSLDPSVHYTTQQGKYDVLATGVGDLLTDSRIRFYELEGRYGTKRQLRALTEEKAKKLLREERERRAVVNAKKKKLNEELINDLLKDLI